MNPELVALREAAAKLSEARRAADAAALRLGHAKVDLGCALRVARKHARMPLRQLAVKAGVSAPFLCDIEMGYRFPSAEAQDRIMRALGALGHDGEGSP